MEVYSGVVSGLDLIRLVLMHPDGCSHFIGDVKKGQEFLNTLFQLARNI